MTSLLSSFINQKMNIMLLNMPRNIFLCLCQVFLKAMLHLTLSMTWNTILADNAGSSDRPSDYLRERCPLCFGGKTWKKSPEVYVFIVSLCCLG